MGELQRILVSVNGESTDMEAVRLACHIGRRHKAKIFVVYVIEVRRSLPLDARITRELEKGEQVLERAERVAEDEDYEVETDLLQARGVGAAVVDEAAERNADLIIMGLPYKRRFGEFHLGDAVPYVLRNAPCRVWVLREPVGAQ